MISEELRRILVCPDNGGELKLAEPGELQNFNQRNLKHVDGTEVKMPLEALLIREDGSRGYQIIDDIPVLLKEKGIILI